MGDAAYEEVQRWLKKAQHDLTAAQTLLKETPELSDVICFHSQQCVEKALKAYLAAVDQPIEKTHYLPHLLAECIKSYMEFEFLLEIATRLTDYAVEARYPSDLQETTLEEAPEALKMAEEGRRFI